MTCKRCRGQTCESGITKDTPAIIECPCCDGEGCNECDDGFFSVEICCRNYVDGYLVRAINMACHAEKGMLPVAGGILDQSAWFVAVWSALTNEQNAIDAERWKELSS